MPPAAHSRLSPSAAKQWVNCTASIGFIEANRHLVRDGGSRYADEGTEAHRLAELLLTGQMKDGELPEQFAPVMEYVQECRTLQNRWNGDVFVETKVMLFYLPEETGTCDFAIIAPNRIIIRDLKYGAGVAVSAEENLQLAIYALSFIEEMDALYPMPDDMIVDIGISQPRIGDPNPPWELTIGQLKEFCRPVSHAAQAILDPELDPGKIVFKPGVETCRWCKAKAICPAKAEQALEAVATNSLDYFENLDGDLDLPEARIVTDAQLVALMKATPAINAYLKDVAKYLFERGLAGDPIPGTKLVQGRKGNREWMPEAAPVLQEALGDNAFEPKILRSPADIDKIIKGNQELKNQLDTLTTRRDGKPSIALADDKRPAIAAPTDLFEDLTSDENP